MSILIKGMEMPTEEYGSMTITIYPNGSVMEYIGDIGRSLGYAVPVPPHGRLIDADALLDDLLFPSKQFEQGMRELIGDAPTIIEAEERPAEDTNVPATYDLLYEEGGANTT